MVHKKSDAKEQTKVNEVHDSVEPGLEEDEAPGEFVKVDVIVQGNNAGKAHVAEEGDGVAKNQTENENRVKQQCPS